MVKTGVVYLVHAYAQHKGLDHSYVLVTIFFVHFVWFCFGLAFFASPVD